MLPGPLAGQERYLFGHPVAQVLHGRWAAWLSYAGEVALLGFLLVGLDPDGRVGEVGAFPPSRADALDDQQRTVCRYLNRARTLAFLPSGRAVRHGPSATCRGEDATYQQVGPAEPRVPPGDVVGMHDGRSRHDGMQSRRQHGLAAGAAPVHGQDDGTTMSACPVAVTPQKGIRDDRQRLSTPRSGFGLLGCKTQCHSDQCYP